jgi:hypothetical protein
MITQATAIQDIAPDCRLCAAVQCGVDLEVRAHIVRYGGRSGPRELAIGAALQISAIHILTCTYAPDFQISPAILRSVRIADGWDSNGLLLPGSHRLL